MQPNPRQSFAKLEHRLRPLLPAQLYADTWVNLSPETLQAVFNHLRTLRYILENYVPNPVKRDPPELGVVRSIPQEGALLFTDLAGFTPFMEANAVEGRVGAQRLLDVLNKYFTAMIEIVSKSGGDLLEFTGDAILAQFLINRDRSEVARAVRAGLRMQRAMEQFSAIETARGEFALRMRVGIHFGPFLAADVGTPLRMGRVLLGRTVQTAKRAEGAGQVGRVCLTPQAAKRIKADFRLDEHHAHDEEHYLVVDDLSHDTLGEYEIAVRRRSSTPIFFDRSMPTLITEIKTLLKDVEPLACYLPQPVLKLLVDNAAEREIPPDFPSVTVLFVNLLGISDTFDEISKDDGDLLIHAVSRVFSLIDAMVKAQGGVLQRMTYHLNGSDLLIYFGTPNAHTNDATRAAITACAIRQIIQEMPPLELRSRTVELVCQLGMAWGQVFAVEIGERRGRREYNILGVTANTAARMMTSAKP
ncbi:MAG: adenylate/guanylate cyclase domain-containing protein, partial [Cyanobacteria bacterium P01_H01_bin.121]